MCVAKSTGLRSCSARTKDASPRADVLSGSGLTGPNKASGRADGLSDKGGATRARRRSTGAGHGTPIAVRLTGGNRNDATPVLPLLDALPPVRGRVGRPRRKSDSLLADRGYDHDIYRDQVRNRGIAPAIARRGTLHGTGLGTSPGAWSGVSRGCWG